MFLNRTREISFNDAKPPEDDSVPFGQAIEKNKLFRFRMKDIEDFRGEMRILIDRLSKYYLEWQAQREAEEKATMEQEKRAQCENATTSQSNAATTSDEEKTKTFDEADRSAQEAATNERQDRTGRHQDDASANNMNYPQNVASGNQDQEDDSDDDVVTEPVGDGTKPSDEVEDDTTQQSERDSGEEVREEEDNGNDNDNDNEEEEHADGNEQPVDKEDDDDEAKDGQMKDAEADQEPPTVKIKIEEDASSEVHETRADHDEHGVENMSMNQNYGPGDDGSSDRVLDSESIGTAEV